jgi:hypothetical protein
MRIPLIVVFFTLTILPTILRAQEPKMRYRAKKAVYLEVGGSGGITANFDYLTMESENIKTSIRVGGGVYPYKINGVRKTMPVVPIEFLGFIGREAGNIELGVGYTHRFTNEPSEPGYHITSRFGFRYQKPRGGFLFRIGYIPLLYKDPESIKRGYVLSPAFALSVGTSF